MVMSIESGIKITRSVNVYNTTEVRAQIEQATQTLAELDRLITKIEGLEEVYNKANQILQEAFSELDGFKAGVESITPDTNFEYVRG